MSADPGSRSLQAGRLAMVKDEPFPVRVSGFSDDGRIGVYLDSGIYTQVTRDRIVWIEGPRPGYGGGTP